MFRDHVSIIENASVIADAGAPPAPSRTAVQRLAGPKGKGLETLPLGRANRDPPDIVLISTIGKEVKLTVTAAEGVEVVPVDKLYT